MTWDWRIGTGKERQTYHILDWLRRNRIRQLVIAEELGVNTSLVSSTIWGRRNNRRVLRKLLDLGCPARFLNLPDDMSSREAA
ncbi:hypothetical protein [Nitratidesulfovibrio sp.]|uniref:hypothetical protein n=1 Tax=Nitratidesulfovibrio sp. TaxID=2802297 RepID=UPI003342DC6D